MPSNTTRLLTTEEYAARIGKKPSTIRQAVWRRQIDFLKIGRSIRFTEEMVQEVLNEAYVPALSSQPKAKDSNRHVARGW